MELMEFIFIELAKQGLITEEELKELIKMSNK